MLTDRGSTPGSRGETRSGTEPGEGAASLDARARAILDFERTWWLDGDAKGPAIRTVLAISATRYYQLLGQLIDTRAAYDYDPLVVSRLRRQRSRRRARRSDAAAQGGPRR